jgi:hypothetical protein
MSGRPLVGFAGDYATYLYDVGGYSTYMYGFGAVESGVIMRKVISGNDL